MRYYKKPLKGLFQFKTIYNKIKEELRNRILSSNEIREIFSVKQIRIDLNNFP